MPENRPPASRETTVRQALAEVLRQGEHSAHELSRLVGIPEKAVADHLAHLKRSLSTRGERLVSTAPFCLGCGYVFVDRRRLTCPSRCPRCQGTHLADPLFRIR